jgi:spore coat polysaccharide biosynthesis protein SpsF
MIITILEAGIGRRRPAEMLMAPVAGQPMIWRMVERVRLARTITKVIVAVSRDPTDDALTGYLTSRGVPVFRGEPHDALTGYAQCARQNQASAVVCLSADTPLLDPGLVDEAVRYSRASRSDLVGTLAYPKGMDVMVTTDSALISADAKAEGLDRNSPCDFIRDCPQMFQSAWFRARRDWSAMDWRADTPAGFAIARDVFETLYAADPAFGMEDALDYLDSRPDLAASRTIQAA